MANNMMRENNGDHTKTTLQRTLEKSHDFDIKAVFLRANQMTKANFATLIQACIVLVVVFAIIGAITQPYITVHDDGSFTIQHQSFIEIASVFVVSPLITGLYMLGLSHARNTPRTVFALFDYIPLIFLLALTQLVNSILMQLGLVLLIIPGLYFWMATSFSLMLVADKSLTPLKAILLSCRVFNAYWGQITALFMIMAVLAITIPLTLGLSLIWIMPLYFSLIGVLYEKLIGGEQVRTEAKPKERNESSFDA